MRVPTTLITLVLAGAVFSALPAVANQAAAEKNEAKAAGKEAKWQGRGRPNVQEVDPPDPWRSRSVTINQNHCVRQLDRVDQGRKSREMDEVKAGSFVIVMGHVNHKGVMHATQVDLRLPR